MKAMTMKLIGMLDSPSVPLGGVVPVTGRAVPARLDPVFPRLRAVLDVNPVVRAPTLVCDDGTVLMDSSLIIDYAEALVRRRA